MTCKIFFIVPVVLCGVLGYPQPPNQGYSAHLPSDKNEKLEEIYIRPSGYGRSDSGSSLGHFNHPDLTQVITSRPGYSADFNVRQDPSPSEDELQGNNGDRLKRQAAQEKEEDDDSDMYMEPQDDQQNESTNTETQQHEPQTNHEEVVEDEPGNLEIEAATNHRDNDGDSQHFFPSFAPVFSLGHSRPPQLFHQEPFYNKPRNPPLLRPEFNPFRAYRDSSFKVPVVVEDDVASNNIFGSGNFGVIRGGTYYNDEDRNEDSGSLFNPYYSNNGHGRPYVANPRPQKYNNGDFFANFRDFADINTPTKASFSEYVIVYVNKNGSQVDNVPGETARPKNIIEQLSLLDKEDNPVENEIPKKKLSTHKRKLSLLHQEKLNKQKKSYFKKKESPKDLVEPLLALS